MPVPTFKADPKLDTLLRAALTAPQRHSATAPERCTLDVVEEGRRSLP